MAGWTHIVFHYLRVVEAFQEDIRDIIDVTGTDPEEIRVFTAADWKDRVFEEVLATGTDVGEGMSQVMQDEDLRSRGEAVNELVQELVAAVRERSGEELAALQKIDEAAVYKPAADFLAGEFGATVSVVPETEADAEKASQAEPFGPAILLS